MDEGQRRRGAGADDEDVVIGIECNTVTDDEVSRLRRRCEVRGPDGCTSGRELGDESRSAAFGVAVAIAELYAGRLERAGGGGEVVGVGIAGGDDVAFGVDGQTVDISPGIQGIAITVRAGRGAVHIGGEE